MTAAELTFEGLRRLVWAEVADKRLASYLPVPMPNAIRVHPRTMVDLMLTVPDAVWSGSARPVLGGVTVTEDQKVPEHSVVLEWWGSRFPPVRLWQEPFGEWAQMVRDGVQAAHPWLRLPGPRTGRQEARTVFEQRTWDLTGVEKWVSPEVLRDAAIDEVQVREYAERDLWHQLVAASLPESAADKIRWRWTEERPPWAGQEHRLYSVCRPSVQRIVYPVMETWEQ